MSYVMTVTLTPTRVLLILVLDTSSVSFLTPSLHVSSVKDGVEHEYYVRPALLCSHLSLIIAVLGCCSMLWSSGQHYMERVAFKGTCIFGNISRATLGTSSPW
ncbi:hypothetical protein C8J55DRAFT_247613 [Lentinula edodes]|uniref:Uncharacterized protein n=1 Tax=Lentinula lateritia TaxID=40482 RepID=A0A9W9DE43_9AGAR|nr:hypothetical protein C8J55DRAFT_247613 [Lentinula edodes]